MMTGCTKSERGVSIAVVTVYVGLSFLVPVYADVLSVGNPSISGNQYSFPIVLNSESSNVAVMDFQFQYDPAVFRPVEAMSGPQADYANKLVNANQSGPGEYIVVLWGPNQNTLSSGEVARIVMEHTGVNTSQTQLDISRLTMASPDGIEINAQAQNLQVELGDASGNEPPDPPEDPVAPEPENPAEPGNEVPGNGAAPAPGSPALMSANDTTPENHERDETKPLDTGSGNSQNALKRQEITDPARIARLSQQAAELRNLLPTPDTQQTSGRNSLKKDFAKDVNSDTIATQSVRAEPTGEDAGTAQSLEHLARANPGDMAGGAAVATGAANAMDNVANVGAAKSTTLLYYVAGGLVVGLILLFSLRKKIFA